MTADIICVLFALACLGWFAFFCAESAISDQRDTIKTRTDQRDLARRDADILAELVDEFRRAAVRSENAAHG